MRARIQGGHVAVTTLISATMALFLLVAINAVQAGDLPVVVINEIMWDGDEYIELRNTTGDDVDLAGWVLKHQKPGQAETVLVSFAAGDHIAGNGYFLIEKKEEATTATGNKLVSGLTLLNTGEQLKLVDSGGTVVDTANQLSSWFAGKNTETGVAMERNETVADGTLADSWHSATINQNGRDGTPGLANSSPPTNQAPQAEAGGDVNATVNQVITFSGEDSADPDGDTLTYAWDFGDGQQAAEKTTNHSFATAGTFTVRLTVSDGAHDSEDTLKVTVTAPHYSDDVLINEFLPDPAGSDTTGEFIELFNKGSETVDLVGWKLDDADGGSAPFTIPIGTTLGAGSYRSFSRTETGLALNNSSDSVRLLAPDGAVKATFSYTQTDEGVSFNYQGGSFTQSSTVTPGQANIITAPVDKTEEGTTKNTTSSSTTKTAKVAGATIKKVELVNVRKQAPGTSVETEGVVSAVPGVLGKRIMYLAGSGIQLFVPDNNDYQDIALGSRVRVRGELGSYQKEVRIVVESAEDLEVIGDEEVPSPHQLKTGEIGESTEGWLVTVQGEVSKTSGSVFYLNDGSGDVKIAIKESTGIDKPPMKKGMALTITGIVSRTTSGYRILPREQEDIQTGRVAGALARFPATGVLAATLTPWNIVLIVVSLAWWRDRRQA